ncbi:MAG: hypothetical protein C0501_16495 [Isosphaera sp.]|nr:hypothetical protein [Isosphaera sp.]
MASVNGISNSGLNFTGLATGIDTQKIIDGLNKFAQARLDTFAARKADLADKQGTFVALQAKLFDLQAKTNQLARSVGGAFDGRTATTSDAAALTAAAGTTAVPGTATVTVNALAKAAQVSSGGFLDPNAELKTGTLTLKVGTGTATTVTLTDANNTLQGLADAVNAAGGDVRASVINDGSATPFRLLLTSSKTGAANTLAVTNNLTTGPGAAINPTQTTVQAAADASVSLGALTVTSATNQVNDLIPGVSLNLLKADSTKPLTVTVGNNTEAAGKAVRDFVDAFNAVRTFITDNSKFNTDTNEAGKLLGNRDAANLANELSAALSASIPGLAAGANRLSSVGLSFAADGKLLLDSGRLDAALGGSSPAALADLKKLFALSGTSDNLGVTFALGGPKTQPTTGGAPVRVQVTAPATRAVVTATSLPVASGGPPPVITVFPSNNTLLLKLNGLAARGVEVTSGTYTSAELASLLQQRINAGATPGNLVEVAVDAGGKFQVTSQLFGGASQVTFAGSEIGPQSLLTQLGFNGTEVGTGANVAGKFVVDGVEEAAVGSGQTLTGSPGNATTDGLQVRATLSAPGGADLTVSSGLASRLNAVLSTYLDPVGGRFKAITDDFQKRTADIDKSIAKQNDLLAAKTAQLQTRFAAMERAVNDLKGLQNQLSTLTVNRPADR